MDIEPNHVKKIGFLFVYFILLAYLLWTYPIGDIILHILVISAIIWFLFEYSKSKTPKDLNRAFELGLFLMLFDFVVENIGATMDLWQVTQTVFHVIHVPIEIMAITLIGGVAWALAQPNKFNRFNSALDILFFSFFGTLGEFLLIKNNVMYYSNGWTSIHAFLGYFITWGILHYLRYRVVPILWK